MNHNNKMLLWQLLLLSLFIFIYILLIPYHTYGVIKEQQHYINVSWRLWQSHNWLLLHDDEGIYINKPPLLFWLTNVFWHIFGVQNWTLVVMPFCFVLICFFSLNYLFKQIWSNLADYSSFATALFFFGWYVLHYTPLYMHDFLLMAAILVALNALVFAHKKNWAWILYAAALALGILAKGPVVLVFTVPPALLLPLCYAFARRNMFIWYAKFFGSIILCMLMLSAWLYPFWQQIKLHHLQSALWIKLFGGHHQYLNQPWWKYLFVLPAMLLPWLAWPSLYVAIRKNYTQIRRNYGLLWVVSSFVAIFIIMSVIHAKADRYIMPIAIFFALFAAFFIAQAQESQQQINWRNWPLWIFTCLLALTLIIFSPFAHQVLLAHANYHGWMFFILGLILLGLAVYAMFSRSTLQRSMFLQTGLMWIFYVGFALIVVRSSMLSHNLDQLEKTANYLVKSGHPIAYQYTYGGYRYRVGKNMMPDGVILKDDAAVAMWLKRNPTGVVIAKVNNDAQLPQNSMRLPFDQQQQIVFLISSSR